MAQLSALEFELEDEQGGRSPADIATEVVELCLSDEGAERVAIFNSRFLRSRPLRLLLGKNGFLVLYDKSTLNLADWVKACFSHGHMSVWFLSANPSELVSRIRARLNLGSGRQIQIGSGDPSDPLGKGQRECLVEFVASGAVGEATGALCLSHDAAQLYQVFFGR